MTRRRTSVIGHAPPPQPPAPPDPQQLRDWMQAAARELVLSPDGDAEQEQRRLDEVRRRWRSATGRESGNPEGEGARSSLQRLPSVDGRGVRWRKVFGAHFGEWQQNENSVLAHRRSYDRQGRANRYVCHFDTHQATQMTDIVTDDAGPNLGMWADFVPCTALGQHALPVPLFAQPEVLAAFVRQGLLALQALAPIGMVHNDLKPANLCLALPPEALRRDGKLQRGSWKLNDLPLRLIDWETGFAPGVERRHHPGRNDNMSPHLMACFAHCLRLGDQHDRNEVLSGIDWGSDAWSLGWTLAGWCKAAEELLRGLQWAANTRWGIDSPASRTVDTTLAPLWPDLAFLETIARDLQALDRAPQEAGQRRLKPRPAAPLHALCGRLEQHFPALAPDALPKATLRDYSFINPDEPLDEAAQPSAMAQALAGAGQRLAAAGAGLGRAVAGAGRSAVNRVATQLARRRRLLLTSTAAAALLAGGWTLRAEAQRLGLDALRSRVMADLPAHLADGSPLRLRLARAALTSADLLQPGAAHSLLLDALRAPTWTDSRHLPADADALQQQRDRAARAIVLLASLPGPVLAQAEVRHLGSRLLLAAYQAGRALESRAGLRPLSAGAGPAATVDALAVLHRHQRWPLAALLQVHWLACLGEAGSATGASLADPLRALQTLPAGTESRALYLGFAQATAQRLRDDQSPCLLPAPAASVVTTTTPAVTPPNPDAPPDLSEITVPGCGAACPSFVLLPPSGRLTLGSGADAITADFSHRVAMGRTEVTVGQWKAFWSAPDRDYQPVKTDSTYCNWNDKEVASSDRLPVACVNVADAEAYIRWFNRRHATGLATALGVTPQRLEVGLPTDLEWEHAARGGRWTQEFLWDGKASNTEKCRYAQINACPGGTIPVATRLPNGFKLHDMIGNVWEWTASPDRARSAIPSNGREQPVGVSVSRVVRGGSFYVDGGLRLSFRGTNSPGYRVYYLGFRLVARIAP